MPSGLVKPGEEDSWEAAKAAAAKELDKDAPGYWKLVNHIFQKMKKGREAVRRGFHAGFNRRKAG